MLENRSNSDWQFCGGFHAVVHCCEFYKKVYSIELSKDGVATPLTVKLDCRNAALGVPQGCLLIASAYFLDHDEDFFGEEHQLEVSVGMNASQLSQSSSVANWKRHRRVFVAEDHSPCEASIAISIIKKMKFHDDYKRFLIYPQ